MARPFGQCRHCGAQLFNVYVGHGDYNEVDSFGSDACASAPNGYHDAEVDQ